MMGYHRATEVRGLKHQSGGLARTVVCLKMGYPGIQYPANGYITGELMKKTLNLGYQYQGISIFRQTHISPKSLMCDFAEL